MPDSNGGKIGSKIWNDEILVVLFSIILIASIHFSRGLVTFASAGIWLTALYRGFQTKNFRISTIPVLLLTLLILWLMDGTRAIETGLWKENVLVKTGFVLTSLSFFSYRGLRWEIRSYIILGLIISFLITSTVSVVNYFASAADINAMLLQSKHVPVFSKMHHIHFGLFLAVSVFVSAFMFAGKRTTAIQRWIYGSSGLILLFNLHVLSSRTGLTGFYAAGLAVIALVVFFTTDRKLKIGLIAGFVLIPTIFILSLPSLRNKILNTQEDIEATVDGGDDINHKSFGMRVEFWKTTLFVVKEHWMIGIGIGNQRYYMEQAYKDRNTLLDEENRKMSSHNQLLETFMTNGLPGLLSLCLILMLSLLAAFRSRSWLYMSIVVLIFWGLQFESMLERQHSALFIALFLFLFWPDNSSPKKN